MVREAEGEGGRGKGLVVWEVGKREEGKEEGKGRGWGAGEEGLLGCCLLR